MQPDTLKLFISRLEDLGAKAYVCHSMQDLFQTIYNLVKNVEKEILIVGSETDYRKELIERLEGEGVSIRIVRADSTTPITDVELSIGFPELGIASTGTVIYTASSGIEEASIYFPETHISIISADRIVYDLDDVERSFNDFLRNGVSIYLVTGPSSTADIEGEIVKGVHGPRRFYVSVLDIH
ncbi:MAG: lactate utilization protein [Nitrososphaerota archaeon]